MPLLRFYPDQGHVLRCDFSRGFVSPEMVKTRPVVVVSPKATQGRRLCTVVPLSTTAPSPAMDWHYPLRESPLPDASPHVQVWAKCDMLYTVSFDRLDKFHKKTRNGREWFAPKLSASDYAGVQKAINSYLLL